MKTIHKTFVLFVISGILPFTLSTGSQAKSLSGKYSYVGRAVNKVQELASKGPAATQEQFMVAMRGACQALTALTSDKSFRSLVLRRKYSARDLAAALDSVHNMAEFLRIERSALLQMGVSSATATSLLNKAPIVANQASEKPSDPKALLTAIDELTSQTCAVSEQATQRFTFERNQESRKIRAQRRWAIAARIAVGIGGVAVITADGYLLPETAGVSSASFSLGGQMVVGSILRK